ncbi:MAG: HEAT repeat domain-containing protein [Planctomycetota bacterium]|nr:HEAT repeat domain-containing protein [Planctomycetota bacterium]
MKNKRTKSGHGGTTPDASNMRAFLVLGVIVVAVIIVVLAIVMRDDDTQKVEKKPTPKEPPKTSTIQIKPAAPRYHSDLSSFEPAPKDRQPASVAALRYVWTPGCRLVYDFRFDRGIALKENVEFAKELADQGMGMNYGSGGEMAIECSGILTIQVYEAGESRCTLGFRFSPVKISIDAGGRDAPQAQLDEMARRLETESLVEITPQGKVVEARLDPSLSAEDRNFLRDWISQVQFVLPVQPCDAWQEMESDTTGLYLGDYSVTGECTAGGRHLVVCAKRKYYQQLFLSVMGGEDPAAVQDTVRAAQSGQMEGGIDDAEGCLVSLAGQQETAVTGGKKILPLDITSSFATELSLREKAMDVEGVARRFQEISAKKTGMVTCKGFGPETAEGLEQAILTFKVGEATFESVMSELALAEGQGQWVEEGARLFGLLVMLFQAGEENVQKALQALTSGQYGGAVLQTLADALAECGRASAETGLVGLAADITALAERRRVAVLALGSVKTAAPETEACLKGLAGGGDAQYVDAAVMSLGWIGSSFSDLDRRARLASFLETVGKGGGGSNLNLVLEALGNVGAPDAFGFLRESIRSENDEVRAYAALAMRKIGLPEVDSLLVTTMGHDESAYVRRMAISALRDRSGEEVMRAISERLLNDQDDSVRVEALKYFIDRMNTDENARKLVEQAKNDPSDPVRDLAAQASR